MVYSSALCIIAGFHSYRSHESYTECSRGADISVGFKLETASGSGSYNNLRTHLHRSQNSVGYWIALTYGGQMTRATKNMAVHQCLAGAVGMTTEIQVVEPFSQESQLLHSPTFWKELENEKLHSAARFSNYYDLGYYNNKSKGRDCASLVIWEQFLQKAPRETVVVVSALKGCWNSKELSRGTTCPTAETCPPSSGSASLLAGLERYGFTVVRMVCLECSYIKRPLTVDEFRQEIYGNRNISELTVIFSAQRNYDTVRSWVSLPEYCSKIEGAVSNLGLISSTSILNHTGYYKRNTLRDKKVIAVMIRIERLFESHARESLVLCLNKTIKLHNMLKQQHSMADVSTFVTLDFGRFGSDVMQKNKITRRIGISEGTLKQSVQETLSHLYNGQWSMEEWEEGFVRATGGIAERGYIAMLQQSIAAHSDCLILMGGGSYQEVTAHQYIEYHRHSSKQCLYTACMKERWKTWG